EKPARGSRGRGRARNRCGKGAAARGGDVRASFARPWHRVRAAFRPFYSMGWLPATSATCFADLAAFRTPIPTVWDTEMFLDRRISRFKLDTSNAANSKDFWWRLGLAWKQSEGLVGLFGDRRVRVFLFYLAVNVGCFGGIFRAVMLGKGQHHHRLWHQYGGIFKEMLVKRDGIVAVAGAIVDAGKFELSERGYVLIVAACERLQGFLGIVILADFFKTERLVVAGEFAGSCAGIF